MISDWTNFAKFGEPRGNWPKFSQSKPIAKIYGDKVYEGKLDNSEVFEALAEKTSIKTYDCPEEVIQLNKQRKNIIFY